MGEPLRVLRNSRIIMSIILTLFWKNERKWIQVQKMHFFCMEFFNVYYILGKIPNLNFRDKLIYKISKKDEEESTQRSTHALLPSYWLNTQAHALLHSYWLVSTYVSLSFLSLLSLDPFSLLLVGKDWRSRRGRDLSFPG